MKKKFLALLLVLAMMLGVLASCGGNPCTHVDKDDNGKCDTCGEDFTDGDELPTAVAESVWKDAFAFDNVTIKMGDQMILIEDGVAYMVVDGEIVAQTDAEDVIAGMDYSEQYAKFAIQADGTYKGAITEGDETYDVIVTLNAKNLVSKMVATDGTTTMTVEFSNHGTTDSTTVSINRDKTYTWTAADAKTIKIELNRNTCNDELSDLTKRYMAGDISDLPAGSLKKTDTLVATRNGLAKSVTMVTPTFQYRENDGADKAGWSSYYSKIQTAVANPTDETPDVYSGFAYDLHVASALGCFINLYDTTRGNNYFTFLEDNYNAARDDEGYLMGFMRALSLLPNTQMYLIASNYTLDVVRSINALPLNITLLQSIPVADANTALGLAEGKTIDANGNGLFDVEEFYEFVMEGKFSYTVMANLCTLIAESTTDNATLGFGDTLGFVFNLSLGLAGSAITFSVDFSYYDVTVNADGTYSYTVAGGTPETAAAAEHKGLMALSNAFAALMNAEGVYRVANGAANTAAGYASVLKASRGEFAKNKVLFAGVEVIGAFDENEYQMMDGGFGILPLPLYEAAEGRTYTAVLHNLARVSGIARSSTKFSEVSAYYDFQSINSDDVMNEYYKSLQYQIVGGEDYNVQMLDFLRSHTSEQNRDQYLCNTGTRLTDLKTQYPCLNNFKVNGYWRSNSYYTNNQFDPSLVLAHYRSNCGNMNEALAAYVAYWKSLEAPAAN